MSITCPSKLQGALSADCGGQARAKGSSRLRPEGDTEDPPCSRREPGTASGLYATSAGSVTKDRSQPQTRGGGGGAVRFRLCQVLLTGSTAMMGRTCQGRKAAPRLLPSSARHLLDYWGEAENLLTSRTKFSGLRRPRPAQRPHLDVGAVSHASHCW